MDTSSHPIQCLFKQLGLASSDTAVENFAQNTHLPKDTPLGHGDLPLC